MNDRNKRRSYFVPEKYQPSEVVRNWAMDEFNIDEKEVGRQLMLMRDHEFRRPYSDWDRVFRNWIRKADEIQSLKRERKPRQPDILSETDRKAEHEKWLADMKRLGVKVDGQA
jgi:hypothetical protein